VWHALQRTLDAAGAHANAQHGILESHASSVVDWLKQGCSFPFVVNMCYLLLLLLLLLLQFNRDRRFQRISTPQPANDHANLKMQTQHTSHVTRHTPHATRHTSHVTGNTGSETQLATTTYDKNAAK
jgi:hypothetical protein